MLSRRAQQSGVSRGVYLSGDVERCGVSGRRYAPQPAGRLLSRGTLSPDSQPSLTLHLPALTALMDKDRPGLEEAPRESGSLC